jgi:hypothetical protein
MARRGHMGIRNILEFTLLTNNLLNANIILVLLMQLTVSGLRVTARIDLLLTQYQAGVLVTTIIPMLCCLNP